MDYRLAKEIYGSVWFIDPITMQQYSKTLDFFKSGGKIEQPEIKSNSFGALEDNVLNARKIQRSEVVAPGTIALYNFDGPITKYGGMSHYGTTEIASQFAEMESNDNVIGHIFFVESGGGSANAIKYIRDFSSKENRTKPLVAYSEDVMASAAMYIASDADYIIANRKDAMIGSIGTMIQLSGYKSGTEDGNGERHMRIYASQSTNKNLEFEKAINDLDYELIRSNLLDPLAAEFIADMEVNRPNITAKQKTGAIFRAEEVVGTLIDEIGDFSLAVNKVRDLASGVISEKKEVKKVKANTPRGEINNQNNSKMTKEEFKAQSPTAYEAIVQEGVLQERDRVEAWAVYNEVNPEKVKAGIESGQLLSGKAMAEFNLEISKGQKLEVIKDDNTDEVKTDAVVKTEEEIAAESNKQAMDELFKEDE